MREGGVLALVVAAMGASFGCAAPREHAPTFASQRSERSEGFTENGRKVEELIASYQPGQGNGWPLVLRLKEQLDRAVPWTAEMAEADVIDFDLVYEPREGEEIRRDKAISALGRLEGVGFLGTLDAVAASERFVRPAQAGNCFDWELPELGWIRHAARASAARLRVMLEQGDEREAARSLRHIMALSRMGCAEPFMTGNLVGSAVQQLGLRVVWGWLLRHSVDTGVLRALAEELDRPRPTRALALGTEQLWLRDAVEKVYAGPSVYENLLELEGKEPTPERTTRLFLMVPLIAGRSRALACVEVVSARMLAVGAMPLCAGMLVANDVDAEVKALPHSQLVVQTLASPFARRMHAWTLVEAQDVGVRTMLAVELFRAERGILPRDLTQLVPAYLETVLEDPYTCEALRYRAEAGGYVLYSVGLDRQDNGGREHAEGPLKAASEEGAGCDIVFRGVRAVPPR